ncbi:hypothetical protein HTY52_28905, partial [Cupriavidus taiwanensis]|nr:hypothetical protein [Cupriavidus taiwanensis]
MTEKLDLEAMEFEVSLGYGASNKVTRALIARIRELEASAAMGQVPEGYALVPVEPTPEMVKAGANSGGLGMEFHEWMGRVVIAWSAMLAAAPTPPATSADDARDAARYRWLRDTLTSAVGGGIEVNDDALVYQKAEPGKEVRVYWYPDTPVGFYDAHGSTIDAAIDAAAQDRGGREGRE